MSFSFNLICGCRIALQDQELLLVQGLSWHLAPVTPCDLIAALLGVLPVYSSQPSASTSVAHGHGACASTSFAGNANANTGGAASASSAAALASSSFAAFSSAHEPSANTAGGRAEMSAHEHNLWEFVRRDALRALYALSLGMLLLHNYKYHRIGGCVNYEEVHSITRHAHIDRPPDSPMAIIFCRMTSRGARAAQIFAQSARRSTTGVPVVCSSQQMFLVYFTVHSCR